MSDATFTLAGYEVLDKLGEGGMAVVWKARQLSLDRLVAIKTLAPQWLQDQDALARFRQEAQAAARLKHSGIVQVFDAGETANAVYYIMEYVQGYTLAQHLQRKGPLDETTALQIALGVAIALDYAWETARIIHCDIKPDNLMIDKDGTVKVADLGLARAMGRMPGVTEEDFIVGTPNYISPEQARGDQNLDCRTDIYALGATLYHLVTSRLPFGDTPGTAPLERQQNDFLLDPLDLNPKLSAPLAALIEKMMVKDTSQRTGTWAEVLSDIQEVTDGFLPASGLPTQGLSTVMRGPRRTAHPGKRRGERAPRKKIVLPSATASSATTATAAPSPLKLLLVLAALIGALGIGLFLFWQSKQPGSPIAQWLGLAKPQLPEHPSPRQGPPPVKPPPANPVPVPPPATNAVKPVLPVPPPSPKPPAVTNATVAPPTRVIRSSLYLRGRRFADYALLLLTQYHGAQLTLPVFNLVEASCRQAISDFQACGERTSDREDVEEQLSDCNRLLANARLSTKLARTGGTLPPDLPPRPSMDLPPPAEVLRPAPMPKPVPKPPEIKPPPRPVAVDETALAEAWKKPPAQRTAVATDFRDLLALYPLEDENLAAGKELILYNRVRYGMPADEAARLFNANLGQRQPCQSPLFPEGLYGYYLIDLPADAGYTRGLLVVNPGDRVVAVQLINDDAGGELALPPTLFQSRWRCYDFVRLSEKQAPQEKIGYRIKLIGRLLRLDSELAGDGRNAPQGVGPVQARSMLFLPQALAFRMFSRLDQP